jgi:transposase
LAFDITEREVSVAEARTIGLDLAKHVFQAHGADASGRVVFRKRLRREQVLEFFAGKPACVVAMEACSSAHHWGRALAELGHTVRLIPPAYVKPFVKRQKNDVADAEAICEAAQRPRMRFVAVKSEVAQANAVAFRARDLLVRQRTQAINAVRGHLGEYCLVVAKGPGHVSKLAAHVEDAESGVPEAARQVLRTLVDAMEFLSKQIERLDCEIARRAREDENVRRLTSIPGVGPITATALAALAPSADAFRKGRDFAAWTGLTPLQHSRGGKQKLGATSKMGERTLRRLLIIGASSVVCKALREGAPAGSWLERMLARKPRMLVIVALANKMACIAWALMAKGEVYRAPTVAA